MNLYKRVKSVSYGCMFQDEEESALKEEEARSEQAQSVETRVSLAEIQNRSFHKSLVYRYSLFCVKRSN